MACSAVPLSRLSSRPPLSGTHRSKIHDPINFIQCSITFLPWKNRLKPPDPKQQNPTNNFSAHPSGAREDCPSGVLLHCSGSNKLSFVCSMAFPVVFWGAQSQHLLQPVSYICFLQQDSLSSKFWSGARGDGVQLEVRGHKRLLVLIWHLPFQLPRGRAAFSAPTYSQRETLPTAVKAVMGKRENAPPDSYAGGLVSFVLLVPGRVPVF